MIFAKRLKQALSERGMSQIELANEIGKAKSSVSQYISGKTVPGINVQEQIAQALNCSVEYLNSEVLVKDSTPKELRNILVSDAAKRLGKSPQFVYQALQQGVAPFGFAVHGEKDWAYHISPKRLDEYIGGIADGTVSEIEIESRLNAG